MYEYDDTDRLVAATTTVESEWDEHERAWMLALAAYRAALCPGCSGNLAETTDPRNERRYVSEALRCHRCTSQAVASLPFQEPGVTAPQAILYTTQLRG